MAASKSVKPSVVRAWATEQGLTTGARGKFSEAVIRAYNAANPKAKYLPGLFAPTHTVVAKRTGKPPVRMVINDTRARAVLIASGLDVPARGRLSFANQKAYALLGR